MRYILVVACVLIFSFSSNAQKVIPFKAILNTKDGKVKGVLQKIDSSSMVLERRGQFITVAIDQIESVKIRKFKNSYRYKNYLKDTENEQRVYRINRNGDMVDQYGSKAPTLGQEVAGPFWLAAINSVINTLALPVHAINPNVAMFKVNCKPDSAQYTEISYYSLNYQLKPNLLAELKRLKEISGKSQLKQ